MSIFVEGSIRVLGYVRVSSDKQAASGLGEAAQIAALQAEAVHRNWALTIIHEEASSARSMLNRPKLGQALADLKAHRADALAVAKLDRLSRSVHDFSGLLELSGRQGWALICMDLNVDTTTITGAAMAQITVTFAELERKKIGERTKAAMAAARVKDPSVQFGRRPEIAAEVVDRIVAMRRSGHSFPAIAEALNAAGVPTVRGGDRWNWSSIRTVARRAGAVG